MFFCSLIIFLINLPVIYPSAFSYSFIVIPRFADNLYLIVILPFLHGKNGQRIYEFLFIINTLIVIPPFLLCKNGQGIYEFSFLLGSKRKRRKKSEDALTLVYTSEACLNYNHLFPQERQLLPYIK